MGLKVAMVTPWHVKCGIATYSENLAKALAKQGVDVYIVRLPRFGRKTNELLQVVVDDVPAHEVDLVHVQGEYGLYKGLENVFYAALHNRGKPVVTTMHAVGNWGTDVSVSLYSDKVILHNKFCFRKFGYPKKSVVIPHGCSPVTCPPKDVCKTALGANVEVPLVSYVGFISSYKGLEKLIQAMVKVPNTGLVIGGGWHVEAETEYIVQLKRMSSKLLPERCQWLGYVKDKMLSTVYGAADLIVYPSRFATESGALLMALSHGKAVIASNLPPMREKEKVGALMTFKNIKDLTRKIKRLLKDEELQRALEEGAKKYCEENSWSKIAEKHISLYQDVLSADNPH